MVDGPTRVMRPCLVATFGQADALRIEAELARHPEWRRHFTVNGAAYCLVDDARVTLTQR